MPIGCAVLLSAAILAALLPLLASLTLLTLLARLTLLALLARLTLLPLLALLAPLAGLALLALLVLLTALTLLTGLTGLAALAPALLSLPRALLHAAAERLGVSREVARALDRVRPARLPHAPRGLRRLRQRLAQLIDVDANLRLEVARELFGRAPLGRPLRVADLLLQLVLADAVGRFGELPRDVLGVLGGLVGHPVELLLQARHLLLERVLALAHHLRAPDPIGAGIGQVVDILGDVLLLARDLLCLPERVLDVAAGAVALRALQLALRLAQPLGGRGRLPLCAAVTVARGPTHRIGGVAQLPGRVGQVLSVLIP